MRRLGAGITVAVLLAGLAATAAHGDDGDLHSAAPQPKMWWDGWFTAAAPKPDKKDDKKPDTVIPVTTPAPSSVERAAASRQRERADMNRRMEVCDRLTEVAVEHNDTAMQTQVDQLRDRVWQLYQQRTAGLPASGSPAADEPDMDRGRAAKPFASGHLLGGHAGGEDGSVVREVKP